jgi:hypothetical protein
MSLKVLSQRTLLVGRPFLAGCSMMRRGLTQGGEPTVGEHAQQHYVASVRNQTLSY